jgi:hypothetical protein
LCADLSWSEARKNCPSRIDSTLCGEYPFWHSLALRLRLSGSVQRHQRLEDAYLKPEMRSYFNLLIKLKVCLQSPVSLWVCSNFLCETSPHRNCIHPVWQTSANEEIRIGIERRHASRRAGKTEHWESSGSI